MGADVEQAQGRLHTGGFLTWGQPFVDLLDHERIMPLLKVILGDGFRLDHYYAIYLEAGAERLGLHGGNTPYDPPEYYHFRQWTDVQWADGRLLELGRHRADAWRFLLHSGQHKVNYPCPQEIREAHVEAGVCSGAGGESRVGGDFY